MVKFIALYKKPSDVEAFEKYYNETHAPLARKIPGLEKFEVCRFTGSPGGELQFYMMAELYFADKDAMMAGLSSDEGKAAARDVMKFAGDLVHMMFAEVSD